MHPSDAGTPGLETRRPNPEAIAWYVEEAQRLLEDQQRQAESLRTRGGQIAGFGAAVLALIGGNASDLLVTLDGFVGVAVGVVLVVAVCSLAIAITVASWGTLRPGALAAISAEEITNYASEDFLTEPDLWRVHARSLHALGYAITRVQGAGDSAATAIEWSLTAFLTGLAFSSVAVATLLAESI